MTFGHAVYKLFDVVSVWGEKCFFCDVNDDLKVKFFLMRMRMGGDGGYRRPVP